MDIKQLIGETTDYDKKVALETKKPKSWCKSISAFANCYGGRLVFGVANDDALVGLSDAEGDAEKISEIIKTHLNPIPEFELSFEKDKDKTFVIVEVMKGQQTPYYYEGDGQLIAFMRIGNESVPATPSQLRELVLRGSGESYDSLKSRYDFSNMSFTKLKSVYKQRTGNAFEDTDYESFGLIDEKGNLTNAGALLADESPVRHSRLFCTRWNGLTKASGIVDALDDKEYTGSLVTLLQAGTDFVRNNSKKAWRKVGDGRIEMPDYPDRAVLEGVVNALIHRNYMEMHYDFTSLIAEHESAEDYCKDSDELNSKIKIYQEQYEKIESFFAPQEMIGTIQRIIKSNKGLDYSCTLRKLQECSDLIL